MEHRPHQQPLVMVRRPQMAMGLRPHRAIRPQTIMRTVCQIMAKNKNLPCITSLKLLESEIESDFETNYSNEAPKILCQNFNEVFLKNNLSSSCLITNSNSNFKKTIRNGVKTRKKNLLETKVHFSL